MSLDANMVLVQKQLSEAFSLSPHPDKLDFINHLAITINRLIVEDFERLVQILYRIDVSEEKLTNTLKHYQYEDAGFIIARLIVDRQLQKINSRSEHSKDEQIPDGDEW
jgi:hypothetical protein